MKDALAELLHPQALSTREQILASPSPVSQSPGVYAWYFREIPADVPHDDCVKREGLTLLYVGIAPTRPFINGKSASQRTLAHRLREHMQGTSEGSTLRISLGCLLAPNLGLELRRVGSGRRMTFGASEQTLSEWMARNAFVAWTVHERPWEIEEHLIHTVSLPLNLKGNRQHPFYSTLTARRKEARERACALPILPN